MQHCRLLTDIFIIFLYSCTFIIYKVLASVRTAEAYIGFKNNKSSCVIIYSPDDSITGNTRNVVYTNYNSVVPLVRIHVVYLRDISASLIVTAFVIVEQCLIINVYALVLCCVLCV